MMSEAGCKIFIACAGSASRWGNYRGVPKQLVPVDGKPILHRTVELLRSRGNADIFIVTHRSDLGIPGCHILHPANSRWLVETLLSTRSEWSGRILFLLGDVWYSHAAMDEIVNFEADLGFFGRSTPNELTGRHYGEMFGVSFAAAAIPRVTRCLEEAVFYARVTQGGRLWRLLRIPIVLAFLAGLRVETLGWRSRIQAVRRMMQGFSAWRLLRFVCTGSVAYPMPYGRLWSVYRLAAGFDFVSPYPTESTLFHEIHDFTDDFDCPADYDQWLEMYTRHVGKGEMSNGRAVG
jgi:hypothetical protein